MIFPALKTYFEERAVVSPMAGGSSDPRSRVRDRRSAFGRTVGSAQRFTTVSSYYSKNDRLDCGPVRRRRGRRGIGTVRQRTRHRPRAPRFFDPLIAPSPDGSAPGRRVRRTYSRSWPARTAVERRPFAYSAGHTRGAGTLERSGDCGSRELVGSTVSSGRRTSRRHPETTTNFARRRRGSTVPSCDPLRMVRFPNPRTDVSVYRIPCYGGIRYR